MNDKISYTGFWTYDKKRLGGTLTIGSDGSVELFLIEGFDLREYSETSANTLTIERNRSRITMIHGETTSGREITLLDCVIRHENYGLGIPTDQRLSVRYALVGSHLDDSEAAVFVKCSLRVENLRSWMGATPFDASYSADGSATLTVQNHDVLPILYDGYTVTPRFSQPGFGISSTRDGHRFTTEATVTIEITSEEPKTLQGFQDISKAIIDIVTIASDQPCGVISQILSMEPQLTSFPHAEDDGTLSSKKYPVERNVAVFVKRMIAASPGEKAHHFHDFLFTCHDMPFDILLKRWLVLREKVKRSTDMLLTLKYSTSRFLENQILTAAVSAETMSRCLRPDACAMLPSDFDRLVGKLRYAVDKMDAEDRDRFNGIFRNEPTFADRLRDIASIPSAQVVGKILPDIDRWIKDLKGVRNGLAHGLAQSYSEDVNLFLLLQRTQYLLYIVIIHELGLSERVQYSAVETNQYISYLHAEQL